MTPAQPLRSLALHLATALDLHARTCRANGVAFPEALGTVTALAWSIAKGDHEGLPGTPLALLSSSVHPAPMLLTIPEVAAALALSDRQVKRLVADGTLPSVVVESARRVRRSDLDAYVDSLGPRPFRQRIESKNAPASPSDGPAGRRATGGRAHGDPVRVPASPPRGAA